DRNFGARCRTGRTAGSGAAPREACVQCRSGHNFEHGFVLSRVLGCVENEAKRHESVTTQLERGALNELRVLAVVAQDVAREALDLRVVAGPERASGVAYGLTCRLRSGLSGVE